MLPKTKYARSDDVRIAYQITGNGPFDVVWAPGTMSHLDLDWEIPQRALFFERFSKFCRLIRFDKRGTGLSDRPVKMATLEERTDDIRAVMDDVGIEGAHFGDEPNRRSGRPRGSCTRHGIANSRREIQRVSGQKPLDDARRHGDCTVGHSRVHYRRAADRFFRSYPGHGALSRYRVIDR